MSAPPGPFPGLDPALALDAVRFAVVDVETTGTRAEEHDRITEIAVVLVDGLTVGAGYSQLVDPGRPIPWFITQLTGIDDTMVRGQPTFERLAPAVAQQLTDRVFVAHNASFDWRFVAAGCARAAVPLAVPARLCTVRLARRVLPTLPRRSLDSLAAHFGIANEARHRASGDARATALALVEMLALARAEGVESWGHLEALLGGGGRRAASRRQPA